MILIGALLTLFLVGWLTEPANQYTQPPPSMAFNVLLFILCLIGILAKKDKDNDDF